MPSKLPEKKTYKCLACQDTKKDSTGGDCFPCSINRQIARPDAKPRTINTNTKVKSKLKPRILPPKKP